MTYSNTNRDKAQASWVKSLQKAGVIFVAVVLTVSSVGNITNQYLTIKNVDMKNADLLDKVANLEIENHNLKLKLEYATTEAFKERKAREWLGLGTSNDNWIDLPKVEEGQDLYDIVNEEIKVSNVKKWFLLFTNQK